MCVLYKLLHLHCIFEAHPFEIERLLSSSEGSVKEAKRSLSEGKVFGQAVRIARYGKVRGAWVGWSFWRFGGGQPERRRGLLAIFGTNKTLLWRRKTNEKYHQRVFCFGKDIAIRRFSVRKSLRHIEVTVPTGHQAEPSGPFPRSLLQPLC